MKLKPGVQKQSILLVEASTLFRHGLASFLDAQRGLRLIGHTGNETEALTLACREKPALVLFGMPSVLYSRTELVGAFNEASPKARIILMASGPQPSAIFDLVPAGLAGCISRHISLEELEVGIRLIAGGGLYFCSYTTRTLDQFPAPGDMTGPDLQALTTRELRVVQLVAEGRTSKEIATQLDMPLSRVELHRHRILQKLNFKNTASLVTRMTRAAGVAGGSIGLG
jgi:DNA-binding NarL/FixJ family response regulator